MALMVNGPYGPYGKRPLWETAILRTAIVGMAVLGTVFKARNHNRSVPTDAWYRQ